MSVNNNDKSSFWTTLPGILTGVAAIITACGTIYALRPKPDPSKTPSVTGATNPVTPGDKKTPPKPKLPPPYTTYAVIDDPQHWTVIRSQKTTSSQVVYKVPEGEKFMTYNQSGNWWQVRTLKGKVGYMHLSRIRELPAE